MFRITAARLFGMILALMAGACSPSLTRPVNDTGVNRIFATVRGVT